MRSIFKIKILPKHGNIFSTTFETPLLHIKLKTETQIKHMTCQTKAQMVLPEWRYWTWTVKLRCNQSQSSFIHSFTCAFIPRREMHLAGAPIGYYRVEFGGEITHEFFFSLFCSAPLENRATRISVLTNNNIERALQWLWRCAAVLTYLFASSLFWHWVGSWWRWVLAINVTNNRD